MDFIEEERDLAVIPLELTFQDQQVEHDLYGHGGAVRFYFLQVRVGVLTPGWALNGYAKHEKVGEADSRVALQFCSKVYDSGLALRVFVIQSPWLEGGQSFHPRHEIALLVDFHVDRSEVGHLDFGELPVQGVFGAVNFVKLLEDAVEGGFEAMNVHVPFPSHRLLLVWQGLKLFAQEPDGFALVLAVELVSRPPFEFSQEFGRFLREFVLLFLLAQEKCYGSIKVVRNVVNRALRRFEFGEDAGVESVHDCVELVLLFANGFAGVCLSLGGSLALGDQDLDAPSRGLDLF